MITIDPFQATVQLTASGGGPVGGPSPTRLPADADHVAPASYPDRCGSAAVNGSAFGRIDTRLLAVVSPS